MAAIFGIFNFTLDPLTENEFTRVREAMSVIPATDSDHFLSGPVALGSRVVHEPGYTAGEPPLVREIDGVEFAVVADARLDNRRELVDLLALDDAALAAITNSELILECYLKWGDDCARYLLGDFVFAVWSGRKGGCFLARDQIGIKPLFLFRDDTRLVFATDLAGVLAHPAVSRQLSDVAVAQFLSKGELCSARGTFYAAVQKLPPATFLRATPETIAEKIYWRPENSPGVFYKTSQEYAERLRDLFQMAVADRLPGAGPIGTHLSGGLDSSAIAAMAANLLGGGGRELRAWTWLRRPQNEEERSNPEWARGTQVADALGISLEHTEFDTPRLQEVLKANPLSIGDSVDLYYEYQVRASARAQGVRVMLSGWGGDQFITHNGRLRYFETFWSGGPVETLRAMWAEARSAARPIKRFLGLGYYQLARPLFAALIKRGHRFNYLEFSTPEISSMVPPALPAEDAHGLNASINVQQLGEFNTGLVCTRVESWAVAGARAGMEYRYPLLDRRIVEFAIGLPPQLYRAQGHSRLLFRTVVKDMLPPEICWNNAKYEHNRVRDAAAVVAGLLGTTEWVDGERASRYIDSKALRAWIRGIPGEVTDDYLLDNGLLGLAALKSLFVLELERNAGCGDADTGDLLGSG